MTHRARAVDRPGLAKARFGARRASAAASLVVVRQAALARGSEPMWRELLATADTVSEGGVREEASGRVWYGSTSLILPLAAATSPALREFLAAFAARDLHVRLRAIRVACREATLRSPGPLGSSVCEIRVSTDSQGVRIDVELQAPLIGGAARRRARDASDP